MSRTFTFQADFSNDTLAGVGYALIDPAGVVMIARTTAGIVNLGGGSYGAELTLPDTFSVGFLRWDDGQAPPEYKSLPVNAQALVAEAGVSAPSSLNAQARRTAAAKLAITVDALPSAFDDEYQLTLVLMAAQSPQLAAPDNLTGPDAFLVGCAAGCFIAARLALPLRIALGSGAIVAVTSADGSKTQFAGAVYADPDVLIKEGQETLSRISFVQAARVQAAKGVSVFGLAGRRRSQQAGYGGYGLGGYGYGGYGSLGLLLLDYGAYPLLSRW